MKAPSVEFTFNMLGPLSPWLKSALYNYLVFPNLDNWKEIYHMSITNKYTVWEAVMTVDPTFPNSITIDSDGDTQWAKIPTTELLIKAIGNAVFKKELYELS